MIFQQARERWERFRENRRQAKAARAALSSHHGHGRFFLLHVPATATILAAITEWYWALLFCIEATGRVDWDWNTAFGSTQAASGAWSFLFEAQNVAVLLGLMAATIPIVMLSMVWLPVQFAMRGSGRWRRGTVIMVGLLANILVIVSGTVVMNYNRQDQVREALAIEQQADADRNAIVAERTALEQRLREMRNHENQYMAVAATVGAEEFERSYLSAEMRRRETPERVRLLERSLGAARQADALEARIIGLIAAEAAAPQQAEVAANVEDNVGRELNTFAQYVEVWRPPFVAVICTLIGIFGAWWVLALLRGTDPRDVLRSGWADEAHRIEDLRDEPEMPVHEMVPPKKKQRVYNPDTGQEEVFIQPKGYWRATGKKKTNKDGTEGELAEFVPEPLPDETGVSMDSDDRRASPRSEQDDSAEHDDHVDAQDAADQAVDEVAGHDGEEAPDDWEAWGEESAAAEVVESDPADEAANDDSAETNQDPKEESAEHSEPPVDATDAEEQDDPSGDDDENSGHYELPDNQGTMSPTDEPEQDAPRPRGLLPAE